MTTFLKIIASPRGERSYSLRVTTAFQDAYLAAHPDASFETLDLFSAELPAFDAAAAAGKYATMKAETVPPSSKAAWDEVLAQIKHFKSFDAYLLAVPMWNFGMPYLLKQYMDVIIQPNQTFRVGENGYEGMVQGKKAVLVFARSGEYPEDAPMDFQKPHLEWLFKFMGITDQRALVIEPTMAGGPDVAEAKLAAALAEAKVLGREF